MTLTAQQRIDALLSADFFADTTGRIATRRDVLDALPSGPCLDRYIPKPVSLPKMPDRLMNAARGFTPDTKRHSPPRPETRCPEHGF